MYADNLATSLMIALFDSFIARSTSTAQHGFKSSFGENAVTSKGTYSPLEALFNIMY